MNYDITLPFEGPQGKLGSAQVSDEEVLKKIGSKLKEIRLEQNMKQKELAEKAGLSMFSISQMETGHNTSVQSIVQFLRALGRLDVLEGFLSRDAESPVADRQRVSRIPFPNHHKEVKYTLPEEGSFRMAAEEDPRNR